MNLDLYNWKLHHDPVCDFCDNYLQDTKYLVFDCVKVKNLLQRLTETNNTYNIEIQVNFENLL